MGAPAQPLSLAVGTVDVSASPSGLMALAGRAVEQRAVAALVEAAHGGRGGVALVRGEPGIGKTALLSAVSPPAGMTVVRCAGRPGSANGVVATAVDAAALSRPVSSTDELVGLSADCPLVLVVDDLHWLDADSLRLLDGLAPVITTARLAVVAAVRRHHVDGAVLDVLAKLRDAHCLAEIEVGPLAAAAAVDLARQHGRSGDLVASAVGDDVALAAGNPLQLIDLWRARAPDAGCDPPAPAVGADLDLESLAVGLADERMPRVLDLSSDARRVLEVAALLGDEFRLREVCAILGRRVTDLLPAIHEALDHDVVGEAGDDCLVFRSVGLRASLVSALPAAVRAELHREIARALMRTGAPAAAAAAHVRRASLQPADLAWVSAVASDVGPDDPELAAATWSRLRAALPATGPTSRAIDAGLASALLLRGDPGAAETVARRALASPAGRRPGVDGSLRRTLVVALMRQGRWTAALALSEIGSAARELASHECAEQTALGAVCALALGDAARANEALGRVDRVEAAGTAVAGATMRCVLAVRGHLAHRSGRLHDAASALREAAATRPGAGVGDPMASVWLAAALADLDRLDEAERVLDAAVDSCRGDAAAHVEIVRARASLRLDVGLVGEAADLLDSLPIAADATSADAGPQAVAIARRALAGMYQDDRRVADRWLALLSLDALAGMAGCPGSAWIARAVAARRALEGDAEGELEALAAGWAACRRHGLVLDLVVLGPRLAAAWASAGRRAEAGRVAGAVEDVAARNRSAPTIQAAALSARALAAQDSERLVDAARRWRDSPRRLEAVEIAKVIADTLTRLGRPDLADGVSSDAARAYLTQGATRAARAIGGEHPASAASAASTASVASVRRRRSRPVLGGREALTRTERVVAEHVERGESNAEIAARLVLSRRTVETHVSSILAKLGMRSRSDLIIAAAARGARPRDNYRT
jgi:DNA-binding CsgD family transcriptional regulator/tetratricopeptide (TPR) repeat protein